MFLTPEIFINLLVDGLILIFSSFAFFISIGVVKYFDINKDTLLQYTLLKRTYLASIIVEYALFFKIILLFYFVFTIDKISIFLHGAMCAAGVISANSYGIYLLTLKVINIYIFGFWILFNKEDKKTKDYHFTKLKFKFFMILFLLLVVEYILEILYFQGINPSKIVSCCGVLFNSVENSAISIFLTLPREIVVDSFYFIYLLILLVGYLKKDILFSLSSFFFILITLLSIILFFSPYIYELPRHKCPFCLLQKEYYFIGYFIYLFLFLGTFFGIYQGVAKIVLKKEVNFYKKAIYFDSLVVLILSFYPLYYYFKNHIWLF